MNTYLLNKKMAPGTTYYNLLYYTLGSTDVKGWRESPLPGSIWARKAPPKKTLTSHLKHLGLLSVPHPGGNWNISFASSVHGGQSLHAEGVSFPTLQPLVSGWDSQGLGSSKMVGAGCRCTMCANPVDDILTLLGHHQDSVQEESGDESWALRYHLSGKP